MGNYPSTERAVSPVIGVMMLVALVVILAVGAGTMALGFDEELRKSPPEVRDAAADLEAGGAGGDQVVKVYHQAGDNVDVDEMEILVTLPNGNTGRLQNMPVGDAHLHSNPDVTAEDDIFDRSNGAIDGTITTAASTTDTDGVWSAGDYAEFRIKTSGDGQNLSPGDEVEIRIVHEPTGETMSLMTVTAR